MIAVSSGLITLVSGADWLQFAGILFVGAFALTGTVITIRSARQATRDKTKYDVDTAKLTVDSEAYQRARDSYEASIKNYEREIGNLSARVQNAEDRADHAEREVVKCRVRLAQFETLLTLNQIPAPPADPAA